ncbi:hypothetical protein [Kitasatospora sp. NBC_01300]|uniref:hypothetical protein n=1 Tax=Kitasatospora sp. NBC_01300 TaxID=2903574 RepID=UPI002F918B43|nr:hypothetical protein OG556_35375 [Kitasatospora sp. NBC_01300]
MRSSSRGPTTKTADPPGLEDGTGWTGRAPEILRSYYLGATVAELCEWYGIPDREAFDRLRLLHNAPVRPPHRSRPASTQPERAETRPSAQAREMTDERLVLLLCDQLYDMEQRVLTSLMGPILPVV